MEKLKFVIAGILGTILSSVAFYASMIGVIALSLIVNVVRMYYSIRFLKEKFSWSKWSTGTLKIFVYASMIFISHVLANLPYFASMPAVITFFIVFSESYILADTLSQMNIIKIPEDFLSILSIIRKIKSFLKV
jgi:hypothetical protein